MRADRKVIIVAINQFEWKHDGVAADSIILALNRRGRCSAARETSTGEDARAYIDVGNAVFR